MLKVWKILLSNFPYDKACHCMITSKRPRCQLISHFQVIITSASKGVLVHNLACRNEFDIQDNEGASRLIKLPMKVVHQDSF